MRLQILSDIHLEFPQNRENFYDVFVPNGDILLLAGDICNLKEFKNFTDFYDKYQKDYNKIFYVPGNHEYYGQTYQDVFNNRKLNQEHGKCQLVNNHELVFGGIQFVFSTLWSHATESASKKISDYRTIENFTLKNGNEEHAYSMGFLGSVAYDRQTIVMTHHLPLWELISPKFFGNLLNSCFVSDQSSLAKEENIHTWVHGHSHDSIDTILDGTRFIRNPYGYYHHKETDFYTNLSVDV